MRRALTRVEAQERAALIEVSSYDVRLDLCDADGFDTVTEVRFTTRTPGATTFLEVDAEVRSVERGGVLQPVDLEGCRLVLRDLAAEEVVRVTARGRWSVTGEGLQRSVDPADGRTYVYSQCFLDDAQQLMACFDQPDLKAAIALTVTAPEDWQVLSTTRATVTAGDETRTHVFAPTAPLPTYLLSLAAGPWHGVARVHDGLELAVWCRQSARDLLPAEELLDLTARSLDLQQQLFGRRYPWGDTYHQVFAPDFVGGAMENPGLVTWSEEIYLPRGHVTASARRARAVVLAHELTHMWFGNLVTGRWWDDLWLSEAFAELLGTFTCDRVLPFEGTWAEFGLTRKAWGWRWDQYPTTHPVVGDVADTREALQNFDGISYAKGASVLRQLMAWVGEDAFFAGVRDYLDRHAFGNAELADLLAALERSSGRDLAEWAQAWLGTTGVPVLRLDGDDLVQSGGPPRPQRVAVGVYDEIAGSLVLRERLPVDLDGERAVVAGLDGPDRTAALLLPNSGDLSYAAVRFDERSWESLRRGLGTIDDQLDRVVAWSGVWDAVRAAEVAPADFVDLVLAHLAAEHDPGLVRTLLQQAVLAATLYVDDPDVLADLHEGLVRLLAVEEPGGDLQVVLARAVVDTVVPGQANLLSAWLDGAAPDGLVVDPDLRWHLLTTAAAHGLVDAERVAAERAADRTDAGTRGADRTSAALPDGAAKEQAWSAMVDDPTVATARLLSVGAGFWQPHQDLSAWADRALAELPAVFATLTPATGPTLVRAMYPRTVVDASVLDRTDALLTGDLHPVLRRTLLEVRDDLARALAARDR